MFQDIIPHIFDNNYQPREPQPHDHVVCMRGNEVLFYQDNSPATPAVPTWSLLEAMQPCVLERLQYLFTVDDTAFFLALEPVEAKDGLTYATARTLRNLEPGWLGFAAATAVHLAHWYDTHRYCGRCRDTMHHREHERALYCPTCQHVEYPKICPAIIVGIRNGDTLLLTKYARSEYTKYALIAGFMEIGETLEDTVRREVQEEVGLLVKNVQYYKSQPWAFSQSILVGFFADVDGSTEVKLDYQELSEATWFCREHIPADDTPLSLTWDMIEAFRQGKY